VEGQYMVQSGRSSREGSKECWQQGGASEQS